jgi:hypothetical protein
MEDVGSDYAMLEVRPDASWEEIQRAYHDLVRVWHPDRFASDRRLQERAERKLQQINDAYRRLETQQASRTKRPNAPPEQNSPPIETEIRFSDAAQPPIHTAPVPLSKPVPRWPISGGRLGRSRVREAKQNGFCTMVCKTHRSSMRIARKAEPRRSAA